MKKIEELEKYAEENHVPIIRPKTLEYLLSHVEKYKPKNILEIGTAIGYSGIKMLLQSATDTVLTTIELNEKSYDIAKQNFDSFGFDDRVDCICGDAKVVLPRLVDDGKKFDMIFLDGPKGQYINYLPFIKKLLSPDGSIFADNVLFRGMVQSTEFIPHRNRTIVVNLRKYLDEVNKAPFTSTLYDIEDGFCISVSNNLKHKKR